jgi:hypothetical protein
MVKHDTQRSQGARTAKNIPCLQIMTAFEVCVVYANTKSWRSNCDNKKPVR